MRRGELVLAGLFGLAGLWWVSGALALPYWSGFAPGSGFLPLWLGAIQLALVAAFVLTRRPAPRSDDPAPAGGDRKPMIIAACVAGAVALMEPLGFATAVALLMAALLIGVERRPSVSSLAIALGATLALHLVFVAWLRVPLPRGPWGF